MTEDENVSALPKHILRRIDLAFDSVAKLGNERDPHARRKPEPKSAAGGSVVDYQDAGGFIVDDQDGGGGFLIDDKSVHGDDNDDDAGAGPQYIPLSLVPTALQQLNLPPDDLEVLDVFRNAASGWGGTDSTNGLEAQEQGVSRTDWRAVCAVLVGDDSGSQTDGLSQGPDTDGDADFNARAEGYEEESLNYEEDEYMDVDDDSDIGAQHASDDEYAPGPSSRKSKSQRKARTVSGNSFENEDANTAPKQLTARQNDECRKAYALFFPDTPDAALDAQKLMIKDIARVAQVLKEKLSAEDIVEMLEMFSSSRDKAMTLADFERMMIAAKMA